jgi:CxxC motif-containing protein
MKMINSAIAPLPIHIGDVMIKDVFGSNVVATENIE